MIHPRRKCRCAFLIFAQFLRTAPPTGLDKVALWTDEELGIGCIPQGVFEVIGHRVTKPRNASAQLFFCFGDMHQPFLERKRRDVAIGPGMG